MAGAGTEPEGFCQPLLRTEVSTSKELSGCPRHLPWLRPRKLDFGSPSVSLRSSTALKKSSIPEGEERLCLRLPGMWVLWPDQEIPSLKMWGRAHKDTNHIGDIPPAGASLISIRYSAGFTSGRALVMSETQCLTLSLAVSGGEAVGLNLPDATGLCAEGATRLCH